MSKLLTEIEENTTCCVCYSDKQITLSHPCEDGRNLHVICDVCLPRCGSRCPVCRETFSESEWSSRIVVERNRGLMRLAVNASQQTVTSTIHYAPSGMCAIHKAYIKQQQWTALHCSDVVDVDSLPDMDEIAANVLKFSTMANGTAFVGISFEASAGYTYTIDASRVNCENCKKWIQHRV